MSKQKGKDAFEFVRSFLEKKPGTPYAEVAEAAKAKGFKIWPIVYGRAQLLLGQAKVKDPSKRKAAKKAAAKPAAAKASAAKKVGAKRGPGRPPKAASVVGGLDSLVAHIRGIERERDQLQSTLDKIRALLGG